MAVRGAKTAGVDEKAREVSWGIGAESEQTLYFLLIVPRPSRRWLIVILAGEPTCRNSFQSSLDPAPHMHLASPTGEICIIGLPSQSVEAPRRTVSGSWLLNAVEKR